MTMAALTIPLWLVCLAHVLQTAEMEETGPSEPQYYQQMGPPENSPLSDDKLMEIFSIFGHSCAFIPSDNATILANLRESLKHMKQMNMSGVTFGLNCMSLLSEKQFQDSLNTHVPPRLPPGAIPATIGSSGKPSTSKKTSK